MLDVSHRYAVYIVPRWATTIVSISDDYVETKALGNVMLSFSRIVVVFIIDILFHDLVHTITLYNHWETLCPAY